VTALGPALVTGASGGIGSSAARFLARAGRDVALHAHSNPDRAESVAAELRELGVRAEVVVADLMDRDQARQVVEETIERLGDLEVLVCNAGIDVLRPTYLPDTTDELWDRMLAIHLTAPFVMARAAVKHFLGRGSGNVVTVSSIAGRVAWPGNAGYNSAKAGLINLTRTIATEYASKGIRANCVCPGIVDTQMSRDYIDAAADPVEAEREANAAQPMNRMGHPDEIGAVIAFLASPAASFVTGEAVAVDGGFLAL
jgi:NAD(P)-dependent dehydrogenase (short-subunit alcohol dehydrogenase family)